MTPSKPSPTPGPVLAALLSLAAASACDEKPIPAAEASADVPTYRDGAISFSQSFFERAELSVETVERRRIVPVVEATGTVDFSSRKVAVIGARIFGRVVEVEVIEGDRVEEGEELARVESAELGEVQAKLSTLKAQTELAAADKERKEVLVREGIASKRAAEVTQKELEVALARKRAAAKQVRSMVGSSRRGRKLGEFFLTSPIAGEVVGVHVYQGQAIEPSHAAFEVADLSELWIELAVFERDLRYVSVGDRVRVEATGTEGTVVPGIVDYVGSVLDPGTRTAEVRIVIDNHDRRLRVSQSVVARIESQKATVEALAVPRRAIVLVDGQPTVFVITAPGQVEPRYVKLGARDAERVEIVEGLAEGDEIVVDGVFALKSELFR
ncbi:MAG: efflux RND transporter periplasmic adaptor subunit [Enhygromyxa sp.]